MVATKQTKSGATTWDQDKMKQLVADLRGQPAEAAPLDPAIRENVAALGFGGREA